MDWHDGGTPVGMAHHVVAAVDPYHGEASALERPDDLGSRRGRDVTRHRAARYQKSGYVECQSQLIWWPDLFKQQFQAGAQILDCRLPRGPLAERGDIGAQMGGCIPVAAVLILLDDVRHVNDMSHNLEYGMSRPVGVVGCT